MVEGRFYGLASSRRAHSLSPNLGRTAPGFNLRQAQVERLSEAGFDVHDLQGYARRGFAGEGDQVGNDQHAKIGSGRNDEALAGLSRIERRRRDHAADIGQGRSQPGRKLMRVLRRLQAGRNPYEQRIVQHDSEPRERMTDRRLRKEKTSRRPGDVALVVQGFQRSAAG
jgi:hypothetical protein